MKILVTGGTGFIGRYVVPELLAAGHEVALLVRESYGVSGPLGTQLPAHIQTRRPDLQLVYADLRNFRQTLGAAREAAPDVVIHLAAAGATNPFLPVDTALRHNVNGALNLLRACCEHLHVDRVIVGRTPGETTSMNVYAASKAAAWNFCEMFARTRQTPIVGAMIFQSYGLGQPAHALVPSACRAALANEDFPMTSGTQMRDWIHVSDVARGIVAMVDATLKPGTTIELGTGTVTSVADVVRAIYHISESEGQPLVGALPGRPGEEQLQIARLDQNQSLGWRPSFNLASGLKVYLDSLRAS